MDAQESMSLAIVRLDETLSILEYGVVEDNHLNPIFIANIHSSIDKYLDTANFSKRAPLMAPPKLPDLEPLHEKTIAVVSPQEFSQRMAPSADRRQKLAQLIAANGREWPLNQ